MPSGTEVHIGVYDFHERQHAQLLQRRNDLVALLMYLTERRLFFSINHVFSSVTGRRESEDFAWFQEYFPADRDAQQPHAREPRTDTPRVWPAQWDKIAIGGSDAHALAVRGYGLHGSSRRARQGRILRGTSKAERAAWRASPAASRN